MTVRQRAKQKPVRVVTGSYGMPVFNMFGLVVGVEIADVKKWRKPKCRK